MVQPSWSFLKGTCSWSFAPKSYKRTGVLFLGIKVGKSRVAKVDGIGTFAAAMMVVGVSVRVFCCSLLQIFS